MRFGKRFAEVERQSEKPYISYKELKQMVGQIASSRCDPCIDTDADEDDVDEPSSEPRVVQSSELLQRSFFQRMDSDLGLVTGFVSRTLESMEAGLGEWQAAAVQSGLLFTDEQLDEVASQMPFPAPVDAAVLTRWLLRLPPAAQVFQDRQGLVERFIYVMNSLHEILWYIEVNLTAVRKILKKLEKKIPASARICHARDYKKHHGLYSGQLQDVLVVVASMRQLIVRGCPPVDGENTLPSFSFGPESMSVLQQLQGPLLNGILMTSTSKIDVYAKPSDTAKSMSALVPAAKPADLPSSMPVQPQKASSSSRTVSKDDVAQQAVQAVTSAELFRGPPSFVQHKGSVGAAINNFDQARGRGGRRGNRTAAQTRRPGRQTGVYQSGKGMNQAQISSRVGHSCGMGQAMVVPFVYSQPMQPQVVHTGGQQRVFMYPMFVGPMNTFGAQGNHGSQTADPAWTAAVSQGWGMSLPGGVRAHASYQ